MKTYIKFIILVFLKSFLNIFFIMLGLIMILNLLSELDFFKNTNVNAYFPLYLSLLNSPSLIFEMFPFIFLLSTQFFFIKFFKDNEIQIFKYSGLKNLSVIKILCTITFMTGVIIVIFFYVIYQKVYEHFSIFHFITIIFRVYQFEEYRVELLKLYSVVQPLNYIWNVYILNVGL